MSDIDDITERVRDAIMMNVDLMDGPPHIVERALASAGQARRRRRRRRAVAGALAVTAGVGAFAGVAVATRDRGRGVTVTAGSSTSTGSAPTSTATPVPVWDVEVTRAKALARGRDAAIDPNTAIVQAKLASWAEIQASGAAVGRSPSDEPDRRVWVVSISGPVRSRCCPTPHAPFRWGVVFIDASTGDAFASNQRSTGDVAPWFAGLPDHWP